MKELDIPDIDLKKELKRCKSMEDLVGKDGLMQRLFGNIIQQFLEANWGSKYPIVIQSWHNNWENLSTYFDFPPEIRRIIYTTNALEGFNRQIITKYNINLYRRFVATNS